MSIARIAPEKFELQDLVCAELALRFGFDALDRLLVEPKGGEDASLFTAHPDNRHFEVQVKGVAGTVKLVDLAMWLTHFPERSKQDMLLERLVHDQERRVLIVVSGRVSDDLSGLVAPADWSGNDLAAPAKSLARDLREAFRKSAINTGAKGKLLEERQGHHAKIAAGLDDQMVASAVSRIVFVESATTERVRDDIGRHLRAKGMPVDIIPDVTERLRAIVGLKRPEGGDIATAMAAQIERDAPTTVTPDGYLEGAEEANWIERLHSTNCLLLSGVTRSGKSVAARYVAGRFQGEGTRVEEFGSIEDAERFLLGNADGSRLALVDDPLGGAHSVPDPERQLHRLGALIPRLSSRRRLVVAQGQERLLEAVGGAILDDVTVAGHGWIDVAHRSDRFLANLWEALSERTGVGEPLRSALSDAITAGTASLEAGSLEYLANLPGAKPGNWSIEEAQRAANVDAATLSRALESETKSYLLPALAVASNPEFPIADEELAFVIAGENGEAPSKATYLGLMFSIGGPERQREPLPEYAGQPELEPNVEDDLETLERRRMVTTHNGLGFTHPLYRAAAELQFRKPSRRTTRDILEMHERALFCRAPGTTRAAARNFAWLLAYGGERDGIADKLFEQAEAGLSSLFPATRDACFEFLMRNYERARSVIGNRLAKAASKVSSINLAELDWQNGEPMLPVNGHIRDDAGWRGMGFGNRTGFAPALAVLETGGNALTPEAASEILLYLKGRPAEAKAAHAAALLSYDVAVLRAEAARTWLSIARSEDGEILARVFSDTHPLVAVRALEGVKESWNDCDANRQAQLLDGLTLMANSPANATHLLQRLVLFDRDPLDADTRPWPIFAKLVPLVLDNLPADAFFVEARLLNAMLEAEGHVAAEDVAIICDRWIAWIERLDAAGQGVDDFILGVSEILYRHLAANSSLRTGMVKRLLSLQITGSLLTVVKDTVDAWEVLSTEERATLLACIGKDAEDSRWRKAVALTRTNVPEAIEAAILPREIRLANGFAALRAAVDPELIEACVGVVCGRPGRLCELRASEQHPVWKEAISYAARVPEDPLFDVAFARLTERAERTDPEFLECLTEASSKDADAVFDHLLEHSIYDGAIARAEHWRTLLASVPASGKKSSWFDRMASAAHEIVDSAMSLDKWLLEPSDRREIEERLKPDRAVYQALVLLLQFKEASESIASDPLNDEGDDETGDLEKQVDDAEVMESFVEAVILLLEKGSPQFLPTIDDARRLIEEEGLLTGERDKRIGAVREKLLPAQSSARNAYRAAGREKDPSDWIFPWDTGE